MHEVPKVPLVLERIPDDLFFPESEGSRDFWGDRMTVVELCDRESVKWPVNEDDEGVA